MPDVTPGLEFPYALDSDSPSVLATVSQGMAERAEKALQSGVIVMTLGTSTDEVSDAVVFDEPFETPPVVVVSVRAGGDVITYRAWTESVTTTGFDMHAAKDSTAGFSAIGVAWHAHGTPAI